MLLIESEKDPRCLVLNLKILTLLINRLSSLNYFNTDIASKIFNILICYFPITFTPPENDPFRITSEMIFQAFEDCMTCDLIMAHATIPHLIDQLKSNSLNYEIGMSILCYFMLFGTILCVFIASRQRFW